MLRTMSELLKTHPTVNFTTLINLLYLPVPLLFNPQILSKMIDYFERKEAKVASEQTSLEEIIERVRGDEFKHITSLIRSEETASSTKSELKGKLPGFTAFRKT